MAVACSLHTASLFFSLKFLCVEHERESHFFSTAGSLSHFRSYDPHLPCTRLRETITFPWACSGSWTGFLFTFFRSARTRIRIAVLRLRVHLLSTPGWCPTWRLRRSRESLHSSYTSPQLHSKLIKKKEIRAVGQPSEAKEKIRQPGWSETKERRNWNQPGHKITHLRRANKRNEREIQRALRVLSQNGFLLFLFL